VKKGGDKPRRMKYEGKGEERKRRKPTCHKEKRKEEKKKRSRANYSQAF
jgi:hypothetical protein